MTSSDQLPTYYQRGLIFENMIITEFYKHQFAHGLNTEAYYWRDSHGLELDLVYEKELELHAAEIKTSQTSISFACIGNRLVIE